MSGWDHSWDEHASVLYTFVDDVIAGLWDYYLEARERSGIPTVPNERLEVAALFSLYGRSYTPLELPNGLTAFFTAVLDEAVIGYSEGLTEQVFGDAMTARMLLYNKAHEMGMREGAMFYYCGRYADALDAQMIAQTTSGTVEIRLAESAFWDPRFKETLPALIQNLGGAPPRVAWSYAQGHAYDTLWRGLTGNMFIFRGVWDWVIKEDCLKISSNRFSELLSERIQYCMEQFQVENEVDLQRIRAMEAEN